MEDGLKTVKCPKCGKENRLEVYRCVSCRACLKEKVISQHDRDDEAISNVKKVLDFGMKNEDTKDKLAGLLQEIVRKMAE